MVSKRARADQVLDQRVLQLYQTCPKINEEAKPTVYHGKEV